MNNDTEYISLALAAQEFKLSRITVAQAVREKRLEAVRLGGGRSYYTTRRAMRRAIEDGKLRPRAEKST